MKLRIQPHVATADESENCYTVADLVAKTKLSKATIYEQIASGKIGHIKIGRAIRIPQSCYNSWLDSHRSTRKTA